MAGDWFPLQYWRSRCPEIVRVSSATGRSRHEVLGWICDFWSWVSTESADGNVPGVGLANLVEILGGDLKLWEAFRAVGWIGEAAGEGGGISVPGWDYWLCESGKKRLKDAQRKRFDRASETDAEPETASKKRPKNVRKASAKSRLQNRREQKRRKTLPLPPRKRGAARTTACVTRPAPARRRRTSRPARSPTRSRRARPGGRSWSRRGAWRGCPATTRRAASSGSGTGSSTGRPGSGTRRGRRGGGRRWTGPGRRPGAGARRGPTGSCRSTCSFPSRTCSCGSWRASSMTRGMDTIGAAAAEAIGRAATGTSAAPRGLRRLAPRKATAPTAKPDVRRQISSVRPALFEVFRGLIAGERPWPLYLWGEPGTGKTSAALALLDLVGPEPVAGKRPDLIRDWVAGFVEVRHLPRIAIGADQGQFQWSRDGQSGDVTREALDRALRAAPLFVFDELGVAREASDFRLDLLLDVLGARCDHPVKPFVVTSNRSPDEIERQVYDGRVASRVLCGTVFNLDGPDLRFAA